MKFEEKTTADRQGPSKRPSVFAREATGLIKSVSLLDAVAINLSYMSIGAALALVGFTMVLLTSVSGVNLVYGSMIAAVLAIPQVIVYTLMIRRTSRTGGDYVWLSRSLGSFLGSTITFMGITLETMPYLALISLSAVFAIGSVGLALGNRNFLGLAVPGSDTFSQFIIGSAIFVSLIVVNIFRPRIGFKIISIFWVLGVLSLVLAILSLISAGRAGVVNYIDSLAIPNTNYASIVSSYSGTNFSISSTLIIMPFFALFSYPWFNAAPSVGSELKSGRTIRWNVPLSFFLAFLMLTVPFATMYYVGGFEFTTAAFANPTLVNDYSFNFWTLAMGVSHNFILSFIIGLGWIALTIGVLAFGIITISRYLLAQSFDRFLPSRLAYVSPKYRSPVLAHLLDLVITVALIGLASYLYGTISSLYGAVLASMIYFGFVGVATVVYSVTNKAQRSRFLLGVAGILQTLVFAYLAYGFLAYRGIGGVSIYGGNSLAYGYITATFVAGSVIYILSRWYNSSKKGIDISLAFKEIPPE